MNERLRTTMMRRGVTTEDLAAECGIDVKSVERWISLNRVRIVSTAGQLPNFLSPMRCTCGQALLSKPHADEMQASLSLLSYIRTERACRERRGSDY